MEQWRQSGCVPDSDEEDELESQQTGIPEQGHDVIQDHVGGKSGGSQREEHDGGNTAEKQPQRNEPPRPQVVIQVSQHQSAGTPAVVDEADDLDRDPLQDDGNPRVRGPRSEGLDLSGEAPPNTYKNPASTTPAENELPSSPDELQFSQHLLPRQPITPVKRSSNDVLALQDSSHSSPLSSPPSNLESPRSLHVLSPSGAGGGDGYHENPEVVPEDDAVVSLGGPPDSISHGRALRPRNPTQINPFRIDIARYEKSCHDAGIAPERIRSFRRLYSSDVETTQNNRQDDESVLPSSSPPQSFRLPQSTPNPRKSHADSRIRHRRNPSDGIQSNRVYGEEASEPVPGLDIPARPNSYSAFKRRKLNHSAGRLRERKPGGKTSSTTVRPLTETAGGTRTANYVPRDDANIFDVPISPPPSGSPTTVNTDKENPVFRYPPDFNPPVLTPVTEQRPRSYARETETHVLLDSSPQSGVDRTPTVRQDNNVQSLSDSSEDDALELKNMRRRIKGVLPASWIRLNNKEQEKRAKAQAEKERLRRTKNDRQNGKGVAQRVAANRREVNFRPMDFLPPEDSDTEDDTAPHATVQRPVLQPIDSPPGLNKDNNVPEDDHIDPISSPMIRQQTNLTETANSRPKKNNTSSRPSGSSSRRGLRQSRITDSSAQRVTSRKPKLYIPRLGILDAPDVVKEPTENRPQFLRVALRRARTCRNQGRSSPTGKVFSLSNRRDTEDVNRALREWREGTIEPNTGNDRITGRKRPHGSQYQPNLHLHFDREDGVQLTGQASEQQGSAMQAEHGPAESTNRGTSSAVETTFNDKGTESWRQTRANNNQQQRRIVRKGYLLSSLRRNARRPADLGYPNTARPQSISSFNQSLSALDASYRDARSSRDLNQSLPLARFLSHMADGPKVRKQLNATSGGSNDDPRQGNNQTSRKIPRKRQPQRINADTLEQSQFPASQPDIAAPTSVTIGEVTDLPVDGLKSIARTCPVDFETSTLKPGTYFHESTFIGSGTFSRSLNISSRNLDVRNGQTSICYNSQTYYWSYWNEVVSSEVEMLFNNIIGSLGGANGQATDTVFQASELYRSLICYINDNLSFMDGIDRRIFVEKGLKLLSKAAEVPLPNRGQSNDYNQMTEYGVRIEAFNLVFANQIRQIAAHEVVDGTKRENAMEGIMTFAGRVCDMIMSDAGLRNIHHALNENKVREQREAGIREQYPFVEAFLIANHIFYKQTELRSQLKDDPLSTALIGSIPSFCLSDAHRLEKTWSALFSIQPLQELDEFGIPQSGLRFEGRVVQWKLVNQLAFKAFEWYESSRATLRPYLNTYVRTLFLRCFRLIEDWGWRDCKPILETLFDFFAKNALHNLSNEETHGSPSFLDDLDKRTRICVDSRDSCFHVLLKVVAAGLRAMSKVHDKKFMRNLAWRLLPNHGRTYPKEEPLRQEDLDALRNHHDLLCILYSSTPFGCRPPLKTVRQLVHPASSHKEACGINIRAWLRLVKYKLSTNEEDSELEEFATWHSDFTFAILKQHSLARTEIETQSSLDGFVANRFVEHAISNNQRQVESLISSSLACLKGAIGVTKDISQAQILIEKLPLGRLLDLFDPRSRRLGEVLCQVLDVVVTYTSTASNRQPPEPPAAVDVSEDSQDYGDWTVFNAICDGATTLDLPTGISYVDNAIRPTLSRLVSRCFGEDRSPDDSVLLSVIHCWTSVILVLVNHGLREWKSYLNPYDGDSWLSLRATDQTRRFTPYFLAMIVEKDPSAYRDCQAQLFSCWLASLVERGSMLKYQHQITSALLNIDGVNNPLFKNLPFSMNKLSRRYEITLDEISQRRVSLISCLLSNMREHLFDVEAQEMEAVRDQYVDMVKAMMTAMKRNYEELGNTSEPVHGSYVEFVHRIVEFLQQHSQEICPIDSFFTDPKSFPLPASDPTYIVARLKSYGVRLTTTKAAKPLVSFIQSVSERAVLDEQQNYLVDQLYNATCDTAQKEDYRSPTLRTFLLQCVYPAYVENSLTTPAAWLLVQPVLGSITRMFADLILHVDSMDTTGVCIVMDSIRVYFEAVDNSLQILIDHSGLLEEPSVLLTLTSFMETIIAALALIDYLDRKSGNATVLVAYIEYFQQFALFAISSLQDPASATAPEPFDALLRKHDEVHSHRWSTPRPSPPAYYSEARSFAACELRSWLRNGWSVHEGKYFVRQGPRSKEVHVSPSCKSADVARGAFVRTVEIFFGITERLETFEFLRI